MKRALMVATVLGACALSGQVADASAAQSCAQAGRTIVTDSVARAFRSGNGVYACMYGGPAVRIAYYSGHVSTQVKVVLSGHFAAASAIYADDAVEVSQIRLADLLFGRIIARPSPSSTPPSGPLYGDRVEDLTLRGRALAWVTRWDVFGDFADVFEVHTFDSRGGALLDRSAAIDPESLAVSTVGSRLYWMDGTTPHTAVL